MRLLGIVTRYGGTVLLVGVAFVVTLALRPWLGYSRFLLFLTVVALGSWFGGLGPGLLAVLLGALAIDYLFFTPPFPLNLGVPVPAVLLAEFAVIGTGLATLVALLRRSLDRAAWNLALLDSLFAGAPVGVAILDHELRYLRVNQALALMNGVPVSAHPGRTVAEVIPEAASVVVPLLEQVRRTGEPIVNREIEATIAGQPRWVLASYYPICPRPGRVLGIGAVVLDVTARKQAEAVRERFAREEAARAVAEVERAQLRTILAHTPSGIIYVDAATGAIEANPAAATILGLPLAPTGGRRQYLGRVLHQDGRPFQLDELPSSRALRGETTPWVEALVVRPNGARVPVQARAAPVRDSAGRIVGAVVAIQDLTAQRELQRLREEWIALIAHDLRQPVTAIAGYAELLARQLGRAPVADLCRAIDHIRTSVSQLGRMINDLLDVSRLEARRLVLECRQVDLGALVRDVVERSADVTRGHPVCLEIRGPIPPLLVDPGRIEQILVNLLSNAAKYGDPGSEIRVQVCRVNDQVEVGVTNRGPGIAPSEMERLFTRFYRTPETRGRQVAGLGLGLYITRGLVEAHGGRIWAESIPNQTTTFRFTLPIRSGNHPPLGPGSGDESSRDDSEL